jgi:glycine cleavage system H protein
MTVKYTKEHEWIAVDGKTGRVGITNYAQLQLGDIVFVELPEAGRRLGKGDSAAVVESVKAASDIYTPVSGTVTAANPDLPDAPETVNEDPEGEGWFFELELADPAELDGLMSEADYQAYVADLG